MRRLAALALVAAGCGATAHRAPPAVLAVRVPTGPLSAERATALPLGSGRAMTVAHVLRAGRPVFVAGRRARVVSVDPRLDLAVLAVPGLRAPAPAAAAAHAGERVTIRALRGALPATVRRVITAHVDGRVRPALELAAGVAPGDSGAPVVDSAGRITGVIFAAASAGGLAYATATVTSAAPPPRPGPPAPAG
jgi:S1-C subfamily serine protease